MDMRQPRKVTLAAQVRRNLEKAKKLQRNGNGDNGNKKKRKPKKARVITGLLVAVFMAAV